MALPEKYRDRAIDAERQAHHARSERERKAFLEIAALWRRLADTPGISNDAAREED